MNKKFLIANWKMNPASLKEAKGIFEGIKNKAGNYKKVKPVVCPPFIYIYPLWQSYSGRKIGLGAQDCFYKPSVGSYTGEVSPKMLTQAGAEYVVLGHSERRGIWETNEVVARKVQAALSCDMKTIICVGEKERDEEGVFFEHLSKEIKQSLKGVGREQLESIIIAYEPLWAIGKSSSEAVEVDELHTIYIFIRKMIAEMFDKKAVGDITIVYGGSVDSQNVEYLLESKVDGFLVGRAGRKPEEMKMMLEILNKK